MVGSLRKGLLRGWYTDDNGCGTATINDGSTITLYCFAVEDLVAEPSLLTIPHLKFLSSPGSAQTYQTMPFPLPWPAKCVVRKAINVSGSHVDVLQHWLSSKLVEANGVRWFEMNELPDVQHDCFRHFQE